MPTPQIAAVGVQVGTYTRLRVDLQSFCASAASLRYFLLCLGVALNRLQLVCARKIFGSNRPMETGHMATHCDLCTSTAPSSADGEGSRILTKRGKYHSGRRSCLIGRNLRCWAGPKEQKRSRRVKRKPGLCPGACWPSSGKGPGTRHKAQGFWWSIGAHVLLTSYSLVCLVCAIVCVCVRIASPNVDECFVQPAATSPISS